MAPHARAIGFITTPEELEQFRGEWERLHKESCGSPYLAYEWLATALRSFPPSGGFFLATVRDNEGVRGIVPLQLALERIGPFPLRVLSFAADGWALRNEPLLSARAAEEGISLTVAAVEELSAQGVSWDCSCLRMVPASSRELAELEHMRPGKGVISAAEVLAIGGSVVIELQSCADSFHKSLSRNRREKIKKGMRLLRQDGEISMVRLGLETTPPRERLGNLMDDALEVSARSWQGTASEGQAISDRGVRHFFREVSTLLASKGMLDLSVLYVGDRPVSFTWGAARWPRTSINKLGFDTAFNHAGAGNIHLANLIADSIARGGREIEFGHEFPEYKKRWGTREDALCSIFLYSHGLIPALTRRARGLKRAVRGLIRKVRTSPEGKLP